MFYDDVFVNALEHGLPPTAGWGLGNLYILCRNRQNCHVDHRSYQNSGSAFVPSYETNRAS